MDVLKIAIMHGMLTANLCNVLVYHGVNSDDELADIWFPALIESDNIGRKSIQQLWGCLMLAGNTPNTQYYPSKSGKQYGLS